MKTASPSPTESPRLVKMSALARLSGVPAATIKHYLREGLIPRSLTKTSRNMAVYDPGLADRIKRIKVLQREHFLPLRVIKSVLDGGPTEADDAATAAAIERTLTTMTGGEARTEREVLAAGASADELRFFEGIGVVRPTRQGDERVFSAEDVALLRVLGAARRAGITPEMLPAEIVATYMRAIRDLVKVELELFRVGVVPRAGADLASLTAAATRLSEELVVLVRRKLLLPTLQRLVEEQTAQPPESSPKKRARAPREKKVRR